MRNFRDDLATSNNDETRAFFDAHLRRFFGDKIAIQRNEGMSAQRRGVDTVIHFPGRTITTRIEEKCDVHAPNNFFLEYISNDVTHAPGWIEKDMICDYIVYGFIKHNRCDFLPWHALKGAWMRYRDKWKGEYRAHVIANKGYNTVGLAVPVPIVWKAITNTMSQNGLRLAENERAA